MISLIATNSSRAMGGFMIFSSLLASIQAICTGHARHQLSGVKLVRPTTIGYQYGSVGSIRLSFSKYF